MPVEWAKLQRHLGRHKHLDTDIISSVDPEDPGIDDAVTSADITDATATGLALITAASQSAGRTALGLGTAATHANGDYEVAGAAVAAQAASQPLDSDLTAIAALSTTSFGRSLLTSADAAAARSTIGAMSSAILTATETTYIGKSAGVNIANPGGNVSTATIAAWWRTPGDDYAKAALTTFDISSLASKTVVAAWHDLTVTAWSNSFEGSDHDPYLRLITAESRRAYVASQATWSVYSTGNSWTAAGAMNGNSDIYPYFGWSEVLIQLPAGANSTFQSTIRVNIARLLQEAIDGTRTTLRLVTGMSNVPSGQNGITVAGSGNATAADRPKLRVSYT